MCWTGQTYFGNYCVVTSLSREGVFPALCNTAMVDLDCVEGEEDLSFLLTTIQQFTETTGSTVGQALLDSWPQSAATFVKVSQPETPNNSCLFPYQRSEETC